MVAMDDNVQLKSVYGLHIEVDIFNFRDLLLPTETLAGTKKYTDFTQKSDFI